MYNIMSRSNVLKKIYFSGAFYLFANMVSAAPLENVNCPTAEEIRQFQLREVGSDYFDENTNRIIFSAYLTKDVPVKNGSWYFFITNLNTDKNSNLKYALNDYLEQIEPISSTPFQYDYSFDYTSKKMVKRPVCFYSIQHDTSIQASATIFANDSDSLIIHRENKRYQK